mgnify:CR=1 FL=1
MALESFNAVFLPCTAAIVRPTTDQFKQQDSFQTTVDSPAAARSFVNSGAYAAALLIRQSQHKIQVRRLLVWAHLHLHSRCSNELSAVEGHTGSTAAFFNPPCDAQAPNLLPTHQQSA